MHKIPGHFAPELYPKPRVSDLFKKFKRRVFTIVRFLVYCLKIVPIVNIPAISAFFQYKSIAKCPDTGKVVPGREKGRREDGRRKTEDGRWETGEGSREREDGRGKMGDRSWKTEDGSREWEDGRWKLEDRRRKSGVGRRKMEVGRRKTEDGSRRPETGDGSREMNLQHLALRN